MTTDIKSLNNRHHKILSLCLRGWTNKDIAKHLNMSPQQISVITKSPQFQHELAIKRSKLDDFELTAVKVSDDEVTRKIREGTLDAVDRLLRGMDSVDERVAVKAATEILDRGGFPKTQRHDVRSLSIVIDAKDAALIKETMLLDKD